MFIPTNSPIWESSDATKLKEFLETQTGERLLANWALQIPSLLDGTDVNRTLVTSGEVKGWHASLDFFISLLTVQPPQAKPRDAYPSIDDDSAWPEDEAYRPPTNHPTK